MKFYPSNLILLTLSCFVLFSTLSCSKDSDLLADYVSADPNGHLVNLKVLTLINKPVVIDPIGNVATEEPKKEIAIVEVTPPSQGTTIINKDNTITYTPDTDKTGTDEFDYTTEVTNPDNTVTKETGSVTVTVTEKIEMGPLKAFPGAEGFGQNTTGGRGGYIAEVTNLNTSGTGSFDAALKMKGARTIIFRVGGTIRYTGSTFLTIPSGSGNVTIAGETAPGDGILIRGAKLRIMDSNVILRHLRFRQDPGTSTGGNDDCITVDGTGSNAPIQNIIIDHCSISWGIDGNLDIRNTWNATIQNCLISYNIKSNLINNNSKNISYIQNIFALVSERAVRANTISHLDLTYEMVNNFLYGVNHPGGGSQGLKHTTENNVCEESNNYLVSSSALVGWIPPNPENGETNTAVNSYFYVNGNDLGDAYTREYASAVPFQYRKSEPLYRSSYAPLPTIGLKALLLDKVGAYHGLSQGLDAVDTQVLNHIKAKTGTIATSGTFPSIANGTPYPDTDKDGMDDEWERANGLDPKDKSDGAKDRDRDGYTNLEEFLHYLTIRP